MTYVVATGKRALGTMYLVYTQTPAPDDSTFPTANVNVMLQTPW